GEASLKFLLCLWLWRSVSPSYARSGISKQKFEMKKHLNWLNKSAVKSIQNAIAYVEGDNYYGAKATINVWEPKIQQQHKFTFLQIWLLSDLFRKYLNNIKAGWQVHSVNF
ncbi:hypothetical protein DY000_02023040, partial [Brassica cretica]